MARAASLFAAASVALLTLGLVLSHFSRNSHLTWTWGGHATFMVAYEVPCYGLAALFAVFACFYALRWIRLSPTVMDWHLGLSLSGVAAFGLALAIFARTALHNTGRQPGQEILLAIAAGMLAGPAAFIVGQLVWLFATIHAAVAQHR